MDENLKEILKAVLETEVDEESQLDEWIKKEKLSDKGIAAVKAALRTLTAYKDELPKDVLEKLAKAGGFPSPNKKAKQEEEEKKPNPFAKPEEEEEMKKKVKKEELAPEIQTIMKAQDDQIEVLKAQNVAVQKALSDERDERELASWIKKAEEKLEHVPGKTADELGLSLQKLAKVDPELAKEQFDQLKIVSKGIEDSNLFHEVGGSNSKTIAGSSLDQIITMADGIVEKSGAELTREQAVVRILKTAKGAELYEAYLKENPAQC